MRVSCVRFLLVASLSSPRNAQGKYTSNGSSHGGPQTRPRNRRSVEAYARVADENGFRDQRFNSCGYSLGATFSPTWMDFPMFVRGQNVVAQQEWCSLSI